MTPTVVAIPTNLLAHVDALARDDQRTRSQTIARLLQSALASKPSSSAPKNPRTRLAAAVE